MECLGGRGIGAHLHTPHTCTPPIVDGHRSLRHLSSTSSRLLLFPDGPTPPAASAVENRSSLLSTHACSSSSSGTISHKNVHARLPKSPTHPLKPPPPPHPTLFPIPDHFFPSQDGPTPPAGASAVENRPSSQPQESTRTSATSPWPGQQQVHSCFVPL